MTSFEAYLKCMLLVVLFPGGDLAVEEVLDSSDASCKIIQFKSAEGTVYVL